MIKPSLTNCLGISRPDLVEEWDQTKNDKTPFEVTPHSNRKAWWVCKNGHSWQAYIHTRNRPVGHNRKNSGCPYCSGSQTTPLSSLVGTHPFLTSQWDHDKNGKLTPFDVSHGSRKKIWWKCRKGHSWRAVVFDRTHNSNGCSLCGKIELKDGTRLDSMAEVYVYIGYKQSKTTVLINRLYGKGMGGSRYDFYLPDHKKFVEVTGFGPHWKGWSDYLQKIEKKRKYVEGLGASFEFVRVTMTPDKFRLVCQHILG